MLARVHQLTWMLASSSQRPLTFGEVLSGHLPSQVIGTASSKIHFPEAKGACPNCPVTLSCAAQNPQVIQLLSLKAPVTSISLASPPLLLPMMSGEAEFVAFVAGEEPHKCSVFSWGRQEPLARA